MIAQRPFLGWGPGTTPLVYPRFRKELSGGVDTALQLHNGPLQIAADAGLAGLAALLLLLAAAARACWRSCAPASIPGRLPLAAVAGTALAAYGAFALYDFELDVPFFSLGGAVCFALLFPRQSATSALPRWPALAVLGLVLALAVVPKIPQLRSHALLAEASDQLENNNPVAFHDLALRASRADRSDTEALNAVAFQLAEMGRSGENPARRTHLIEDAGNRFVESIARNPDQEICETNLAWLLLPNEPARAESHFLAAAALVPEKNGLGLGLARAQLALHRRDAAVQALTTEGLIDPRFLLSPLWREAPFAELRQPVLAAVANRADHLAPEAALAPWQRAELLYLAEFARWLDGTASPGDVVRVALNPEQRAFFGTDEPGKFLVRLAEAKPDEVVRFRAQRPGYGVLTRNLDAPLPADFYESSQYQFVLKEVAFLLPERLNLPGRILLAEFARISSSPP
jgi:hypothetical protein